MKLSLFILLACLPGVLLAQDIKQVPITFMGGHQTYPPDRGRPVVLIAAALRVPADVFRDAFSRVHPAAAGQQPRPEEVLRNKQVLMAVLAPRGVTNDRLDEVSTYYRYNRSRGEMWPVTPAAAYATVSNGEVTGFTITNPGSGYTSTPTATVPGFPHLKIITSISYSTDFTKNGALAEMRVETPTVP